MSDGLRAAAAGMSAQQAWLDALANDVANVNTTAYHKIRMAFRELVGGAGAVNVELGRSQEQGAFQETGRPLDVAIDGRGFLQVKLPDGATALTRGGTLQVDARGLLVTADGNPLVPPLRLPKEVGADGIQIASDGTVTVGTKKLRKLDLVDVPNPDGLVAAGNGVFTTTAESGAPGATTAGKVLPGTLERSDVDLGTTMVSMIEAQRAFDLASRALKMQDELRQIANEIRR